MIEGDVKFVWNVVEILNHRIKGKEVFKNTIITKKTDIDKKKQISLAFDNNTISKAAKRFMEII